MTAILETGATTAEAEDKAEAKKLAARLADRAEMRQRDFPKMANPDDAEIYTLTTIAGLGPVSGDGQPTNPSRLAIVAEAEAEAALIPMGADFNVASYWGNADYTVVDCVYGTFSYGAPRAVRGMKSIPHGAIEIPARVLAILQKPVVVGWDKGPLWAAWETMAARIKKAPSYVDYMLYAKQHARVVNAALADYDRLTAMDPAVGAALVAYQAAKAEAEAAPTDKAKAAKAEAEAEALEIARAEAAFNRADVATNGAARLAVYLYSSTISPWTRVLGHMANSPLQVVKVKPATKKRAVKAAKAEADRANAAWAEAASVAKAARAEAEAEADPATKAAKAEAATTAEAEAAKAEAEAEAAMLKLIAITAEAEAEEAEAEAEADPATTAEAEAAKAEAATKAEAARILAEAEAAFAEAKAKAEAEAEAKAKAKAKADRASARK